LVACLVGQSASQPVSQSVSQSASQPTSQSASKSVSQSASQPASQSVSQSASQSALNLHVQFIPTVCFFPFRCAALQTHINRTIVYCLLMFVSCYSSSCPSLASVCRELRLHLIKLSGHTVGLLWTSDQSDAETSTSQHNTHDIHAPVELEPTVSASERPQTHVLDHAAPGVGYCIITRQNVVRDTIQSGRSADRIPAEASLSTPVQIGPEAHPASCTMGSSCLPGIEGPGRGVDHPPHLFPRLKKE
jgi:hypothetical protein